jgi:hypothetical protein
LACVCVADSRDEAEECRRMLEDFDIPAVLGGPASTPGLRPTDATVPVLVRPELLEQAQQVLESFTATDDPDEWEDDPFDDDDDDDYDDDYDDDDDDDDDDYDDDDDDEYEDEDFDDFE